MAFWRLNGHGKVAAGSQKSHFSAVDFLFHFASLVGFRLLSRQLSLSLNVQIHVPSRVRGKSVFFQWSTQMTKSLTSNTDQSI